MHLTNEQLFDLIKDGNEDLKPVLWERVNKLLYFKANIFYSAHSSLCAKYGIALENLQQQTYSAFERSLKKYDSSRGLFSTYMSYVFKWALREVLRGNKKVPLSDAVSLDAPTCIDSDDKDGTLADIISDPQTDSEFDWICFQDTANIIRSAVEELPDKEKSVIKSYFFEGKSVKAIAFECGEAENSITLCKNRGLAALRRNKKIIGLFEND